MADRKRSKKEKDVDDEPQESEEQQPGNWLTRLLFRPRVLMLLAAGVVLTAAVPYCMDRLPDLSERPEYRFKTADIAINKPPHDVPHDLVAQVIESAELPAELSILDDDLNRRIAESFARHPWVAEVVEVRKSIPAQVTVTLRYRRPAAMVQVQHGLYPIDGEGYLLPPADFSVSQTQKFPIVQNVQSIPQGTAGTPWGDASVVAAARLAAALENDWEALNLQAIMAPPSASASTDPADVQLELLTKGKSRILWGRPPGTNHPGELELSKKIARLKKYQTDFGSFDEPHGPYEIDIRHWREISRRPLLQNEREAGTDRRRS